MTTYFDSLTLTSHGNRVTYHEITEEIKEIVEKSNIKNGICTVSSPHTTCSVFFEEFMHDLDYWGYESIQVDLNRIMENIIPRQVTESQYLYPGPLHAEFLDTLSDPNYPSDRYTILNADAHIRSTFIGASETFIIKDGELQIGTVGYIYFVDWDQNRKRDRTCNVMVIGE